MDKLLLAVFLSALAGFITAALSMVKLVNEKENKTSDFRQDWTNSVRCSLSDLAAKMVAITAAIEYQARLSHIAHELEKRRSDISAKRLEMVRSSLMRIQEEISSNRHDQYQTYAKCKLHFKPGDPDFAPIEEIFEEVFSRNQAIEGEKDTQKRHDLKIQNYQVIQRMVEVGRNILKTEWERVKEGEPAYKATKKYSFAGGIVMLVMLVSIGVYALLLSRKAVQEALENTEKTEALQCWQLQNFGKRIIKLNTCTGETLDVGLPPKP